MEIEERITDSPHRHRVTKFDDAGNEIENFCADIKKEESAEDASAGGTRINAALLKKINWRDDRSLVYEISGSDTPPEPDNTKTQIMTTSDGRPWLVTPHGKKINLGELPSADEVNGIRAEVEVFREKLTSADTDIEAASEHIDDGVRHVTSDERTRWNSKPDMADLDALHAVVSNSLSAKADLTAMDTKANADLSNVGQIIGAKEFATRPTVTGTAVPAADADHVNNVLSILGMKRAKNGYLKLSNGMILQWGSGTASTTWASNVINLPISFSNLNFSVVCSYDTAGSAAATAYSQAAIIDSSKIRVVVRASSSLFAEPYFWFAMGY
jgi:hypothetical protein